MPSLMGGGGGGGAILHPPPPPIPKKPLCFFSKVEMVGRGAAANMSGLLGDQFDASTLLGRLNRDDGYSSRSGSDTNIFEGGNGGSGSDERVGANNPRKRKKYHRHTQIQINELESAFKECPHPDEKQRLELSRRLGLETRQIKFWFQNRRTQLKTQLERHENIIMRQDNDKLRAENDILRQNLNDPLCNNCGGPVIPGPVSFEYQQLRVENARLKDELGRVCAVASKCLGRPFPPPLGPTVYGSNVYENIDATMTMGLDYSDPALGSVLPTIRPEVSTCFDKSMFVDFALAAMSEMFHMVQIDEPLWLKRPELGADKEMLNIEEYARVAVPSLALRRSGFSTEASRATGIVMTNSFALVEMMMDVERWVDTFSGLVARSSLLEVISYGVNGSKDGTLLLMQADFQVISPMVPVRQTKFLRFCKQRAEGVWAVVDVSLDVSHEGSSSYSLPTSVRLPSGCIIEDIANGSCKITWLEHSEYDESLIHGMLRPVISSGLGFGAKRWVTTLQRYCECLNILMASATMPEDPSLMTMAGRKSVLRLAHRMVQNFCSGVVSCNANSNYNGIGSRKWEKLTVSGVSEDVKILTRKSINEPGEPSGVVLVATTSVWLPITKERVFDFLAEDRNRKHWDILSNGGMMPEMFRITKSQDFGNNVSLLRSGNFDTNNADPMNQMVILQEMCDDASGSMLVYAPVDVPSMELTLNGGDHTYVCLLPSGFSIIPDGRDPTMATNEVVGNHGGCILTIGFQILVSSLPAAKLTMESVDTVSSLLSCTIQRIKEALNLIA